MLRIKRGSCILAFKIVGVSLISLLVMMSSASALTITPGTTPPLQWSGVTPDNPDAGDIPGLVGYSGVLFELYKMDVGAATDSGSFASSYITTFTNTPNDPSDGLIKNVAPPIISGNPLYLLVKDGKHDPMWYIFDLTNWNGTDDIVLQGFWPGEGAISHITFYGPTAVPEPTTLLLLGSGLVALGLLRRTFKKKD